MASRFFPLDEELQLLPGHWTPWMHESMVRLGVKMPFEQAAADMAFHHQVTVSKETVRRLTEQAGERQLQVQAVALAHLKAECPTARAGAARQLLSVDGAFVQRVDGNWVEVKTLTLAGLNALGQSHSVSYFSRQQAAHDFITQAWLETHRRGLEASSLVCAVTDGAEWIQTFIDAHRPDAIRILDFYHASEHLAEAGRALFGAETPEFYAWQQTQCHTLKHADPDTVLADLRQRLVDAPPDVAKTVMATLHYLEQRRAMLDYARFQHAHLPIGSGSGEAAHKVVIECRMKQAGMRWAEPNINRLATLRNLVCNDRWDEGWTDSVRVNRPSRHTAICHSQPASPVSPSPSTRLLPADFTLKRAVPWRNRPIGKAAYEPSSSCPVAKS